MSANGAFLLFAKALPGVTDPPDPGPPRLARHVCPHRRMLYPTGPRGRGRGVAVLCSCYTTHIRFNSGRSHCCSLADAFMPFTCALSVNAFRLLSLPADFPSALHRTSLIRGAEGTMSRLVSRLLSLVASDRGQEVRPHGSSQPQLLPRRRSSLVFGMRTTVAPSGAVRLRLLADRPFVALLRQPRSESGSKRRRPQPAVQPFVLAHRS